jgi:8-amino-7-oxononanoate synthase
MRVLVTGASGFLGGRLAAMLAERGDRVRVLARRSSDLSHLAAVRPEVIQGSLEDPGSLRIAVRGVEIIYHCAALSFDWGAWEAFETANVVGVENLARAASRSDSLERFVHVSSSDVYGYPQRPCDESAPLVDTGLPYNRSKVLGERALWRHAGEGKLPLTVVRPVTIYGPRSKDIVLEVVKMIRSGSMAFVDGGRVPAGLVYVDDVAAALMAAARSPAALGKAYNVRAGGGETWRDYVDALADGLGARRPWLSLPSGLALPAARALEGVHRLFRARGRPLLTRHSVLLLCRDQGFPTERIRAELGFDAAIGFAEGIERTLRWLRSLEAARLGRRDPPALPPRPKPAATPVATASNTAIPAARSPRPMGARNPPAIASPTASDAPPSVDPSIPRQARRGGRMDVFEKCSQLHPGVELMKAGFHAFFRVQQSAADAEVVVDGRRMIMLGSNNYLGLASHPRVKRAAMEAIEAWGVGTTGSRVLNGTLELHVEMERRLARFLRRDAALFFTSGYMANLGVISSLVARGEFVVIDRHAHASIVDGARLSHGEVRRFRHNDVKDLERVLESCGDAGKLVAVDGVYSMDGEIAPLPRIVQACRKHGARLVVDDAHGFGVLGREGRGTAEHFGLEGEVDVIVGTTSKSLPAVGGFAAGDQEVIDYLRLGTTNRPFVFAASPPASILAAVGAALDIVQEEPALRRRLEATTRRVLHALRGMGFDTGRSQTPIVPITVGPIDRTFQMWKKLTEEGIFVNVVLPPAVPAGGCLIRMTFTAAHTDEHLERVLGSLERAGVELGIIPDRRGVSDIRMAKKTG